MLWLLPCPTIVPEMKAVSSNAIAPRPTKPDTLTPLEVALVDITRLALEGKIRGLRQRTRNLLRNGGSADLSASARSYLADLLTSVEPVVPALRSSSPRPVSHPFSATDQSTHPLVEHEEPYDAEPPVLNEQEHSDIQSLIVERAQAERLRLAGVSPSSTVLLSGPPGVGKTMTASYLAHATGLPLLRLRTGALMSGLLGQSARNLMDVLNEARSTPSILLLDEFDAYARRRDDALDIAEPKRLVNTLLVELERWPDDCMVVAATNHAELLDSAVQRRFDVQVELQPPSEATRRRLLEQQLTRLGETVDPRLLAAAAHATKNWTGSDLASACRAALRRSILEEMPFEHALAEALVRNGLTGRSAQTVRARREFVRFASERLGLTQREVGRLLGVPHVAVDDILRNARK